ncbi:MAG: metalloregulator ArsR/SmtB family transcription factor [Chloroflexota bacterium]|nr:metalloregulator ArsR/SmtB family transcription factor [Chloroflexota bacterium]
MDNNLREEITRLHAQVCSGLADTNRILILYTLNEKSLNVSELSDFLGLPQPTTSRHLKVLRDRGLVKAERDAQSIYYTLTDQRIIQALDLLRAVLKDKLEAQVQLLRSSAKS